MTENIRCAMSFVKESLDNSPWFAKYPSDGLYRWEHTLRVAHIGAEIARREGLDAEALEAVKKRRYEKLEQMISYCRTTDCLRGYILEADGENISVSEKNS